MVPKFIIHFEVLNTQVRTIREVMILQDFLQGCLFVAEFVYHESVHNDSTLPVYR